MAEDNNSIVGVVFGFCVRALMNLLLLFVLVEGFRAVYHFSYQLFADVPYYAGSQSLVTVTVAEGATPMDLAAVLEQNGIVESDLLFLARVYLGKYDDRIRAGSYSLGPGMSPDEICKTICGVKSGGTT